MIKPIFFAAFSGHRPSNEAGRQDHELLACAPALSQSLEELRLKVTEAGGHLHLISSLAAGSDIIACNEARKLDIPIHLILPKSPERFFAKDFAGPLASWLEPASRILACCTPRTTSPSIPVNTTPALVIPIEEASFNTKNTFRTIDEDISSPDCYASVNTRMLDLADFLLTVWNEQVKGQIAGTSHVVHQADVLALPHLNVNPTKVGSQDFTQQHRLDQFHPHSDPSLHIFQELETHLTCDLAASSEPFEALAKCLGKAANTNSSRFRNTTASAILAHAAAGFIAAFSASFYYLLKKTPDALSLTEKGALAALALFALIEFLLVLCAFCIEKCCHCRKDHHVWLDCRFGRELMRGLASAYPFIDPIMPEVRLHSPQWKRFATACTLLKHQESGPLDPAHLLEARDRYLSNRITHQKKHFTDKHQKAKTPSHWVNLATHRIPLLAVIFIAIALLEKGTQFLTYDHDTHKYGHIPPFGNGILAAIFVLFLPIFLPLLASLSASFHAAFDFGRRKIRYHEMAETLAQTEKWLPTLQTHSDIQQTVRRTEEILLDENIEWLTAQKSGSGH